MLTQAEVVPDSMTPMYRQLSELIRERIRDGRLAMGERISSEAKLGGEVQGKPHHGCAKPSRSWNGKVFWRGFPEKELSYGGPAHKVERLTRLTGFGENMAALGLTGRLRDTTGRRDPRSNGNYRPPQNSWAERIHDSQETSRRRAPGRSSYLVSATMGHRTSSGGHFPS